VPKRLYRLSALSVAALLLAGCATNFGPDDYNAEVRDNYMENCIEGSSQRMSAADATAYCECTFKGLDDSVEFDLFKDFESYLRENVGDEVNSRGDLEGQTQKYGPILDVFDGCVSQGPSAPTTTGTPTTSAPR
jgi:hypothetical protein